MSDTSSPNVSPSVSPSVSPRPEPVPEPVPDVMAVDEIAEMEKSIALQMEKLNKAKLEKARVIATEKLNTDIETNFEKIIAEISDGKKYKNGIIKFDTEKTKEIIKELIAENLKLKAEPVKVATKRSAGGSKKAVKKEKVIKPFQVINQVKSRGFKTDCCVCVEWAFPTNNIRQFSQCRAEPLENGMCKKHNRSFKTNGYHRNGRLKDNSDGSEIFEEGFFGTPAEYNTQSQKHTKWVEDFQKVPYEVIEN